ncbi:MAG: hypothetical protein K2L92_03550 [Muribaculaceae bacterium]|nr:hypothetical protein [Muribaculaceae bacterium]
MSFFDSMRRFFGLDNEYNTDELNDSDISAETSDSNPQADENPQDSALTPDLNGDENAALPPRPAVDPDMRARIFDGVVAIFNQALPDFLSKSVDPARQSELISQSLDASLSEYLDNLSAETTRYVEATLKNAADSAKREADRLRRDMETLEQQRASIREQQLSAERRRRALADRVQDLEAQLASAEAEREQFDLEKKSMLNKIKLADVQPGIIEELQREIEKLKSEQGQPDNTELEKTQAELAEARAALEQQKEHAENSQSMYNDLQHQLVDEREARLKAEAELAEARKIFDTVIEMQKQMQMVEVMIQKRDDRIARLKSTNKKLKEEIAELKTRIADEEEHDGGLFDLIQEEPEPEVVPSPEEEAALANLEDDFECPDWFVSQPAPGEGSLRTSEEPFGYTPPARKHTPENDAQLSLF